MPVDEYLVERKVPTSSNNLQSLNVSLNPPHVFVPVQIISPIFTKLDFLNNPLHPAVLVKVILLTYFKFVPSKGQVP